MRHPELNETRAWVEKLQRWDPQNALFPLITAESLERATLHGAKSSVSTQEEELAWQSAMSAAFQSPKFDDFLDRVAQLNRRVVPRYGFYDPYEVQSREQIDLPDFVVKNCERYAQSLLLRGAGLESKGDRTGGRNQYWTVARFGQMIDTQGRTGREHWMGTTLQGMAYRQLQASSEKAGNQAEAALFGYLVAKFDPARGTHAGPAGESAFGRDTSERNAAVVEISGLMILLFSGLMVIALSILIAGSRRKARSTAKRAKPVATIVVLASAVGVLFSSITLYLTYRPYWYIFHSAILSGDGLQARDLQEFLTSMQALPGFSHRLHVVMVALLYSGSPSFLFYVWVGVTLLGISGLALIVIRHFLGQTRASPPSKRRH